MALTNAQAIVEIAKGNSFSAEMKCWEHNTAVENPRGLDMIFTFDDGSKVKMVAGSEQFNFEVVA